MMIHPEPTHKIHCSSCNWCQPWQPVIVIVRCPQCQSQLDLLPIDDDDWEAWFDRTSAIYEEFMFNNEEVE
jgi:hypothetical protein